MLVVMCILAVFSIFIGFICKDLFIGMGVDVWGAIDAVSMSNLALLESEFLPFYIKNLPFFCSVGGILVVFFFNNLFFVIYKFVKLNPSKSVYFLEVYRFLVYK